MCIAHIANEFRVLGRYSRVFERFVTDESLQVVTRERLYSHLYNTHIIVIIIIILSLFEILNGKFDWKVRSSRTALPFINYCCTCFAHISHLLPKTRLTTNNIVKHRISGKIKKSSKKKKNIPQYVENVLLFVERCKTSWKHLYISIRTFNYLLYISTLLTLFFGKHVFAFQGFRDEHIRIYVVKRCFYFQVQKKSSIHTRIRCCAKPSTFSHEVRKKKFGEIA